SLYSTETFEVLDSPAYRTALASQTAWSKANIARFKNMIRGVARITISRGTGRGAVLGIIRLRPDAASRDKLRTALHDQLEPKDRDGIISMHLLENDARLSKPLTDNASDSDPGAGDWFVLIDGTNIAATEGIVTALGAALALKSAVISSGVYRLMWDLAKSDISAA
ncbi:MAG TPA: hypothetical protein VGD75_03770, partial [Bradyrhizobium sp.]